MDELMEYVPNRVYLGLTPKASMLISEAQVAVVSWLFSRKLKGNLKLNIHDLSAATVQGDFENELITNLKWLGIQLHQSPHDSGESGITRESERREVYKEILWKFFQTQKALVCKDKSYYKISEIIENNGTETAVLTFKSNAFEIKKNEFDAFIEKEQCQVVLVKSIGGDFELRDFWGNLHKIPERSAEHIVLWTKKGTPSFAFARAVDLCQFKISHFVVEKEALPQLFAIYEVMDTMDWEIPWVIILSGVKFTHYTNIEGLRRDGYLPNTIVSILAFTGRASRLIQGQNTEEDVLKMFDLKLLTGYCQLIDDEKLKTLNSYYLNTLRLDFIVNLTIPFLRKNNIVLKDKSKIHQIVDFLRSYYHRLSDLAQEVHIFFDDHLSIGDKDARNILRKESAQKVLWSFLRNTKAVEKMSQDVFSGIMNTVQYETGILGRDLWQPIRIALTGSINQYELARFCELLGRDLCIKRAQTIVGNYW